MAYMVSQVKKLLFNNVITIQITMKKTCYVWPFALTVYKLYTNKPNTSNTSALINVLG